MNKQVTVALAVVGTALMSGAMPYAVTDLQGLMPQAIYGSTQWLKTMVLFGMCIGSIPLLWDRSLFPMPFVLLGIACVVGTLIALPFIGMFAITKLLLPYGGLSFGIALFVHLYFKHLDPVDASDPYSETH
jgi:hypothetical protein|tara:strand:- start:24092 stop:24484 length:393 start_codon:yes stop_codon:yes gene_type:complete